MPSTNSRADNPPKGIALIVAGGLYIIYRERKNEVCVTSAVPMLESAD
jgi:hypothetical protein